MNSEQRKEYNKQYRENKKEQIKLYKELNKDKISEVRKKYRLKNKENIKEYNKQYFETNKKDLCKKAVINITNKLKTDQFYKLKHNIKITIKRGFYNHRITKNNKTVEILGCSFEEFKTYLESKFEPWMTWENRGLYNGSLNYGWDIDHIKPLSTATNENDLILLNHYTNLQPLCSYTNRYIKKHKNPLVN